MERAAPLRIYVACVSGLITGEGSGVIIKVSKSDEYILALMLRRTPGGGGLVVGDLMSDQCQSGGYSPCFLLLLPVLSQNSFVLFDHILLNLSLKIIELIRAMFWAFL